MHINCDLYFKPAVKSIFGTLELRTDISRIRRGGGTPLLTPEILPVVWNRGFTFGTVFRDFVFKEFNPGAAVCTLDVEYGIETPVLRVVIRTFSHGGLIKAGRFCIR